jgi:hypothetical protein
MHNLSLRLGGDSAICGATWSCFLQGRFFLLKNVNFTNSKSPETKMKYIKIMILFTAFVHEFLNKIQIHLLPKGNEGVSITLWLLNCNSNSHKLQGGSMADSAESLSHYLWYRICLRQIFLP